MADTFRVDIDAGQSVGDLKKAIKLDNAKMITGDARSLKLFLAKKGNAWLQSEFDDVKALRRAKRLLPLKR